MKLDYSAKHHILLQDRDSKLLRRMDEPYYESKLIGDGVWQIASEGCLSYLVEGSREAIVIDTGYGCGDIRAFCQMLTSRPVNRVVNTHDHFDHTALNGLFESAIMSAATAPLATVPFPSFDGVTFPQDYRKEIVKDGDVIDLGGRSLLVFEVPDHAAGSIALLDSASRILFIGDEIGPFGKDIQHCVETVGAQFHRLAAFRGDYDWVCHGHMGKLDAALVERVAENIDYILAGHEGEPDRKPPFHMPAPQQDEEGNTIWMRDAPHPGDAGPKDPEAKLHMRVSRYADCEVKYDDRFVFENR
ncbi:MAG: MBL fold metallo-hydrolase [Clostridiales bacterium]|nr:MBL fold metallo-hydrolase [Clostridiales bacterium]